MGIKIIVDQANFKVVQEKSIHHEKVGIFRSCNRSLAPTFSLCNDRFSQRQRDIRYFPYHQRGGLRVQLQRSKARSHKFAGFCKTTTASTQSLAQHVPKYDRSVKWSLPSKRLRAIQICWAQMSVLSLNDLKLSMPRRFTREKQVCNLTTGHQSCLTTPSKK